MKYKKISTPNITKLGVDILNILRRENEYYLKLKENVVNEFLTNNKEYLNNLTLELDTLFSTIKLEELANLYENAFRSCLEKAKKEIKSNELLSNEYFNDLVSVYQDDNKLIQSLRSYHTDAQHLARRISPSKPLTSYSDSITSKSKTKGYLIKYGSFKDSFEKSKIYINEQLYPELLSEYKNFISKIREILQVFKNNKLSDIYPDFEELSFIDDNIRTIDNFYTRLSKHISDDIFNNKYIKLMNDYKISENSEITKINNYIESMHSIMHTIDTENNINYDFCLTFKRKKIYTCYNGVVYTYYNSDNYCAPLTDKSNNHLKLVGHSIYSDNNLLQFHSKFNEFYDILSKKILLYTSKIKELKESLSNIEIETINKGFTSEYLTPVNNTINSLLSNKYGDEIIKSAYNYYQPNIKTRIEPLLDDISLQWNNFFDNLIIDIEKNLDNFKNTITEFPNYAGSLMSVLSTNITNNYFDSINMHQKTEFNYTISYYYNLLIRHVKSCYQYIISKIPANKIGFNNIVNKRKNEVNDCFNILIKNINDSLKEASNLEHQTNVIHIAETNFFGVNDILKNNVKTTQKSLSDKLTKIRELKNSKNNDEFSVAAKYYLENSESGKQIEQLYEQIDQKVFVFLNLDKFNELLIDNWIFDQDEFIKSLNTILYNSKLDIEKELITEKERYLKIFENEITKYYTEDEITKKINDFYKNEVKELEEDQITDIKKNIDEILENIKQHFTNEAKRLKETMVSYNKDYSKIEERLKNYQDTINQKVKDTIFSAMNEFYSNMNNQLYTNYFEFYLNDYEKESEEKTLEYGEVNLFSSKYNVGEIILSTIKSLTHKYKQYIKSRINTDYEEYFSKLEKKVDIKGITTLINEKIDEAYNNILLPVLKSVAIYDTGITEYNAYDLKEDILTNITSTINNKIGNIKKIIDSTKGSDFGIDLNKNWKIFDYSRVYEIIGQNCDKLMNFLFSQKENEKEIIDLFLKNIMMSNFNDLLQNIIPSFGNNFFERIIKYNENFKITSLYNNLQYSLIPTIAFYVSIGTKQIKAITKDLKLKIYSLNDLDLVAKQKNKEVLELLNRKVNEFIENSKDYLFRAI